MFFFCWNSLVTAEQERTGIRQRVADQPRTSEQAAVCVNLL